MDNTRYTVGWIAPLPLELVAARAALDKEYYHVHADGQRFYGGRIGAHDVVLGVQPKMGTDAASALAARMKSACPNIKFFLVVGIGGGVPRYGVAGTASEMVLGDVVVSYPWGNHGGVVRYDYGAWVGEQGDHGEGGGHLSFCGHTNSPPHTLLEAVNSLRADHSLKSGAIPDFIKAMRLKIQPEEIVKFEDPGAGQDKLFQDSHPHPADSLGIDCLQCCNLDSLQWRETRGPTAVRQTDTPKVHYGNIGSSNQLQISPAERSRLQNEHNIICFEMEGAGVIQEHQCLIIRGICDYSDSHKNKIWQPYAALTAAAYAKELLGTIPVATDHLLTSEKATEIREILTHLRTTDPREDKRRIEETKGGLLEDSYKWILTHSDFQKWRDDPEKRLLWIKGDPGKGKTMLLCGIIDELKKSRTTQLSYFFCQATDLRINSSTSVLRGLLYLLVKQQPALVSHIREKYNDAGKDLFNGVNAWFALTEVFTAILEDADLDQTILSVDALDECVEDLPKLLGFIVKVSSMTTRVKWIVSSRNNLDIERGLEFHSTATGLSLELKENAAQISNAVNTYISHCVSKMTKIQHDKELQHLVLSRMQQKSNGTFLWVALIMKELREVMAYEMLEVLEEVPVELKDVYRRMMDQIQQLPRRNPELCRRVLSTIMLTYRPLHLQELYALSDLPPCGSSQDINHFTSTFVKMCGSFLTIRDETVYVIHHSAGEFLSEDVKNVVYPQGTPSVHRSIFLNSLQVMSRTLFRDVYNLQKPGVAIEDVQSPKIDPLVSSRYSCIYWVDHLLDWCHNGLPGLPDANLQDGSALDKFMRTKYLHWLEAISLCHNMPKGTLAMRKLEALVQKKERSSVLATLVHDALRFIMTHGWVIGNYPLQAYASALLFSPDCSLIRSYFMEEKYEGLNMRSKPETRWSPCLRTIEIHDRAIENSQEYSNVAFSRNFPWMVSTWDENTIKIWDLNDGQCLQTLRGHKYWARTVIFSDDSSHVASASNHRTVNIWSAQSGACIRTLQTNAGGLISIALSKDSTWLLSAHETGTVEIRDTRNGHLLQVIESQTCKPRIFIFPNSAWLGLGSFYHSGIQLWDTATWTVSLTVKPRRSRFITVASSSLLACGMIDHSVKIWQIESGKLLHTLWGHNSQPNSGSFSCDSAWLASGSSTGIIKIWDTRSGECLQTLQGAVNTALVFAWSHDSAWLASTSGDGAIEIWETSNGNRVQSLQAASNVHSLIFSPTSDWWCWLISRSKSVVQIWEQSRGLSPLTLQGFEAPVRSIAFSHDSIWLASGSEGSTNIWNTSNGDCLDTFLAYSGSVCSTAFSHNSCELAIGYSDGKVEIRDLNSGGALQMLEAHYNDVLLLSFSRDSAWLASGAGNVVKIWDTRTYQCIRKLRGQPLNTSLVAFSYDSSLIASVQGGNVINIWERSTGHYLHILRNSFPRSNTNSIFRGSAWVLSELGSSTRISRPGAGGFSRSRGFDIDTALRNTSYRTGWDGNPEICAIPGENAGNFSSSYEGLSLSSDQRWIMLKSERLLWLPLDYRRGCAAISGKLIAIGTISGKVVILEVKHSPRREMEK